MGIFIELFVGVLIFIFGYAVALEKVEEIDENIPKMILKRHRETWNRFLDSLKTKSKEDKIKELKIQIEEIEDE